MSNFTNKKICILGFGKEGHATYNYIRKYELLLPITIMDNKYKDIVLDDPYVTIKDVDYEEMKDFDMIFKTPGISLNGIDISSFKDKITSELEYFLENTKARTIGITGTKGKSTTSSLMYKVVSDAGIKSYLVGNIGNPILDILDETDENTIVVLELSAHQLEYVKASVNIGMVLNLYEEHLDHFKTLEHYYDSKMNMALFQKKSDHFIFNADNDALWNYTEKNKYKGHLYEVSENTNDSYGYMDKNYIYIDKKQVFDVNTELNLKGKHNLIDVMFVLAASNILGLDYSKVIESIKSFMPLEHRLELVGKYNEVIYYNDSISTIPETCISAIEALKDVNTLILGGMDRGIDYNKLIMFLRMSNIENVICIPDTGIKIMEEIKDVKKTYLVSGVEEAVTVANRVTKKNMICLLSPAASSYNLYKNFEERGRLFKEAVRKL